MVLLAFIDAIERSRSSSDCSGSKSFSGESSEEVEFVRVRGREMAEGASNVFREVIELALVCSSMSRSWIMKGWLGKGGRNSVEI